MCCAYLDIFSVCVWNFKLEGGREKRDFVIKCDYFHVGRSQTSGRCWGDSILLFGDSNYPTFHRNTKKLDHVGLCGHKDGKITPSCSKTIIDHSSAIL